jgi:UDP-N-acetylglucosamine 2-epimerase (hydrolysing)
MSRPRSIAAQGAENGAGASTPVRTVCFLTGTRADFGKLKALIQAVKDAPGLDYRIFATGIHMLARYGSTADEIRKSGFDNIFPYVNQDSSISSQMDLTLANTISGLGHYLREFPADLIVVHGDRIEALAGATVGVLNQTLVAHVEGGEVSGTVDELIRHAVTKLSHLHFVANGDAARRLVQMGERPEAIHVIGSPDVDIMLSPGLPSIEEVRARYAIPFERYGIFSYHPVTTELPDLRRNIRETALGLLQSERDFVAIYPNSDAGAETILDALEFLARDARFRVLPSMRFEHFLTLLRYADVIAGNSSAGVREAPVYGVPTINIGTRQLNRFRHDTIVNVPEDARAVADALALLPPRGTPCTHFGAGHSARLFRQALLSERLWATPRQKQFLDVPAGIDMALAGCR